VKHFLLLFISILFFSCIENKNTTTTLPIEKIAQDVIAYAEGFTLTKNTNHTVLEINSPWPNSTETFKYVLISAEEAMKTTFMKGEYNGIIITPVKKIVVTSTTHMP